MKLVNRLEDARDVISQLAQAQMTTALCVSRLQELLAIDDATSAIAIKSVPRADSATFCIIWKNRSCYLGCTTSFHLFARLVRRANQYVSHDHLLRDVWQGDQRSPDTVRSAIRTLKIKLTNARMSFLAEAIKGQAQHYGLILRRH